MVSIPKASKEIRSPNHFTPGPAVYEWEKCYFIPPKHLNTTITSSIRDIFPKHEGPGVGQFNIRIDPNVHNYYFGYKPDPYSIERKSPGPSDYNPSNQYVVTKSPSIRIAERIDRAHQNQNQNLGPAYYNTDQKNEFKSLKFSKSKRLFLDQSLNVPGPQKYKIESVPENSPRYSFGRDKRKLGGDIDIGNPGPGSYSQNQDSQLTQRKAIFPKAKNDIFKLVKTPGPGSYNLSNSKITLERGVRFPKGKRSYDTNKNDNPGPQQYVDISFDTYKQKTTNVIIGTSKKPKDNQDFFSPGPGAYNTHSDQFQNNQHKVFLLGKAKNYLDITADRINVPSPTQYEPKINQPDGPKIKFPQRLRDFQMNIQNQVPGPGKYLDKEIISSKYKFAHTSAQRSKFQINSNPGPGKYSLKDGIDISVEKAKGIPKKKQLQKDSQESEIEQ